MSTQTTDGTGRAAATDGTARAVTTGAPAVPVVDVHDPSLSRFELVREGARRDGIEIVHYEPRYPVPGTKAERRMEWAVAAQFLLAGAAGLAFLVVYIWWPWQYETGSNLAKLYTPLLGLTLGLALLGIGTGVITWGKRLLPQEIAIERRHDGPSSREDRTIMAATLGNMAEESGIQRRPLLKGALTLGLLPVGGLAVAPLVGGLLNDPHDPPELMFTGWDKDRTNNGEDIRLVRQDGTPIRPADISVGGQLTVFPGIPGGASNRWADSPVLLIHLREEHAQELRDQLYPINEGSLEGNFVAYSKICTHAGCPPSLYEQQTNRLLCPCHQSQFLTTDNAKPIFGPAARALPMLPITLDAEGYFVATSDFKVPVGPSFWERPA
jgi:ubiquinol-cytochrome c reductase iron-sulfur subunit